MRYSQIMKYLGYHYFSNVLECQGINLSTLYIYTQHRYNLNIYIYIYTADIYLYNIKYILFKHKIYFI